MQAPAITTDVLKPQPTGLPSGSEPLAVDVTNLGFSYGDTTVLNMARCELQRGRSMAVIGPSGCGKTTFLHLLAGLIRPVTGTIRVLGQDLDELQGTRLDRFRGRNIGLVFQRLHLLPALSVTENVLLAQRLSGGRVDATRVATLLEQLDLGGLEHRKPSMLSQGQAQRVAIARALVHSPALIMADEPTSALDDEHAAQALALLHSSARRVGAALLVVTHDQRVRGSLDSELELRVPA
ncbi:MAG: ATP-binding cassette domain-containing protein [Woeseiaceae bacterium]|nr:ATP-binding cassette domain-containing protein [Woeseiaceae bacterium]